MKITSKYSTVCHVGYGGSVSRNEDRRAHGGVCLIQVRRGKTGIIARKINSNGRYQEIGEPFEPTAEQLENWQRIGRNQ